MTVRLLNAAVMPVAGDYRIRQVSAIRFAQLVRQHAAAKTLVSYVGYPECARLLEELCEVPIELNRSITEVRDGDTLLIARLVYRVANPVAKGQVKATLADYEFFQADYSAPKD